MHQINKYNIFISFIISPFLTFNLYASQCKFHTGHLAEETKTKTVECVSSIKEPLQIFMGEARSSGSFGSVHDARILHNGKGEKPVVIKKIKIGSVIPEGYDELVESKLVPIENAAHEFSTMVALHRHKDLQQYIVKPYAFFTYKNNAYIVMEDGGQPLYNFYGELRKDPVRLKRFAENLFRAVMALHKNGIIHLDLHPGNILMNSEDQVKIIDFGLAKREDGEIETVGNVNYRDPEVYVIRRAYAGYDFFSIAAILFEILSGRTIFSLVESPENLRKNPIKPGTEQFEKYVNEYERLHEECAKQPNECGKLLQLILDLLNPTLKDRRALKKSSHQ